MGSVSREWVFDHAKWHLAGEVPPGTTLSMAYVHIGMYVAWVVTRGHYDTRLFAELPNGSAHLVAIARTVRVPAALRRQLDWSLPRALMDPVGRAFTDWYYGEEHAIYLDDWVDAFGDDANAYRVPATRETFDRISKRIDRRFLDWEATSPELSRSSPSEPPDIDDLAEYVRRVAERLGGSVIPPDEVRRSLRRRARR